MNKTAIRSRRNSRRKACNSCHAAYRVMERAKAVQAIALAAGSPDVRAKHEAFLEAYDAYQAARAKLEKTVRHDWFC